MANKHECAGRCEGTVTVPISKYDRLIRIAERADMVIRYVSACTYSPDKKMILDMMGVETEMGGEPF